jgi:hypothetical protein
MFDHTVENGNWVVTYKSPYSGKLMRTPLMQKKYAFDRYNSHGDAVSIEKVKGWNQRRIVKPEFAEWLRSQEPPNEYETSPEHNEQMNIEGAQNVFRGFLTAFCLVVIVSLLCYYFETSMRKILIISSIICTLLAILWFASLFKDHSKQK